MKLLLQAALLVASACMVHAAGAICPDWLSTQFGSNCYGIIESVNVTSWREYDALCRQEKPGSHIAVFSSSIEWYALRWRFPGASLGIGYMYNATSGAAQDLAGVAQPGWDVDKLVESDTVWTKDACVLTAVYATDWELAECSSAQTLLCKAGDEAIPSYIPTTASPSASPLAGFSSTVSPTPSAYDPERDDGGEPLPSPPTDDWGASPPPSATASPSATVTLSPSATATPWATAVPSTQAATSPAASTYPSPTASSRPVLYAPYPWPAQNLPGSQIGTSVGNASLVALRVNWPAELAGTPESQAWLPYLAVGLVHALATTLLAGCDITEAVLSALPSTVLSASCDEPGLLFVASQGWCWSVQPPAGAATGVDGTELVVATLDSLESVDSLPPACSSMGVPRLLGNGEASLRDLATLSQCLRPDVASSALRTVLARMLYDPAAVPATLALFSETDASTSGSGANTGRRLLHAELDELAAVANNASSPITVQVLSADVGRFPSSTVYKSIATDSQTSASSGVTTTTSLKIAGALMIACAALLLGAVAYYARRSKSRHARVAPELPWHLTTTSTDLSSARAHVSKPAWLTSLRARRRNAGSRRVQSLPSNAPRASEFSTRPLEHEVAVSSRYRATRVLQLQIVSQQSWRSGHDDMSIVEISDTTQLDAEL